MSKARNYIVIHTSGNRYLYVRPDGLVAWTYDRQMAHEFTRTEAQAAIRQYQLPGTMKSVASAPKSAAPLPKKQAEPPVILREVNDGRIRYLFRFYPKTGIALFTNDYTMARKFKSFDDARNFLLNITQANPKLALLTLTPVHQNVAHVAETVLANRPSQDSKLKQVVEKFNQASPALPTVSNRDVVRVWTFLNPASTTGLSMAVSVDTGLQKLEAWSRVRAQYNIQASLPAAYDEYRGAEAQAALLLAAHLTLVKL